MIFKIIFIINSLEFLTKMKFRLCAVFKLKIQKITIFWIFMNLLNNGILKLIVAMQLLIL